uniref:Testis cDNA clone: QtsA-12339, similar to human hypothetical protein LOC339803 (LOC339803) n=1 Tax=Macaca fascicularis TaxID=9541 RepID=Q4R8J6_MACFA|nr:unnamed protein product [Macaca fascicularis]
MTFLWECYTGKGRTPRESICTIPANTPCILPSQVLGGHCTCGQPTPREELGEVTQDPESMPAYKTPSQRSNCALDLSRCPLGPLPNVLYFLSFLL